MNISANIAYRQLCPLCVLFAKFGYLYIKYTHYKTKITARNFIYSLSLSRVQQIGLGPLPTHDFYFGIFCFPLVDLTILSVLCQSWRLLSTVAYSPILTLNYFMFYAISYYNITSIGLHAFRRYCQIFVYFIYLVTFHLH